MISSQKIPYTNYHRYVTTHAIELDSNRFIFQSGEVDSDIDKEITDDNIGLNFIRQTLSTHLSVVRCVPSQPAEKDGLKRSVTFHKFTKNGDKNCKMVVNSEICINAISSKVTENLRLKLFRSWIKGCTLSPPKQGVTDLLYGPRSKPTMSCPS